MKKFYKSLEYKHQKRIRDKQLKKRKLRAEKRSRLKTKMPEYKLPNHFSFVHNSDECIQALYEIEEICKNQVELMINTRDIINLTPDAITVLIAFVRKISKDNTCRIFGNYPKDKRIREIWRTSGFNQLLTKRKKSKVRNDGKILYSDVSVNSQIAKELVDFATQFIYKTPKKVPGIFSCLQEMMGNTNEHAAKRKGDEIWWASAYRNKSTRKASFVFVDFGKGIFETVKYKLRQRIEQATLNNAEILEKLLKGRINLTGTGEVNRGNGLVDIYKYLQRKHIKNLIIISNDVFASISENNYKIMDIDFKGTFYYWEHSDGID